MRNGQEEVNAGTTEDPVYKNYQKLGRNMSLASELNANAPGQIARRGCLTSTLLRLLGGSRYFLATLLGRKKKASTVCYHLNGQSLCYSPYSLHAYPEIWHFPLRESRKQCKRWVWPPQSQAARNPRQPVQRRHLLVHGISLNRFSRHGCKSWSQ